MNLRVVTLIMALTFSTPIYAYLDPGSGSMILQSLMAIGIFIAATVSAFWDYFKSKFYRLIGKQEKNSAGINETDDKE